MNFVLAGRDIKYTQLACPVVRDDRGRVVGRQCAGAGNMYGTNTDTIFYVQIVGPRVYMIAIPRDIWLDEWQTKINSMYFYQQASGLTQAVSQLLNVPIEHYAIINIDIFQRLVDALGCVDVNVPYDMQYTDYAAGLEIDLKAGNQTLCGEDAAKFVRFRGTASGDLGRIDNIKTLANSLLSKLKRLNVRAVTTLPALIDTYVDEVETNINPTVAARLLPLLSQVQLETHTLRAELDTVRTHDGYDVSVLRANPRQVEADLASIFKGTPREITAAPKVPLLITNHSGITDLEIHFATYFEALGVPKTLLITRSGATDPTPTRMLLGLQGLRDIAELNQAARYYADLLHISQHRVTAIDTVRGEGEVVPQLELVLGKDAVNYYTVKQFMKPPIPPSEQEPLAPVVSATPVVNLPTPP